MKLAVIVGATRLGRKTLRQAKWVVKTAERLKRVRRNPQKGQKCKTPRPTKKGQEAGAAAAAPGSGQRSAGQRRRRSHGLTPEPLRGHPQ